MSPGTNYTLYGIDFTGCLSLVGGNGTTYDPSYVGVERACIDTEETPGYFTGNATGNLIKGFCGSSVG